MQWIEVDDLDAFGPDARVFELDEVSGVLTFGDGERGAALPDGFRHVVAQRYQVASGLASSVAAEEVSGLLSSMPFLVGVTNPLPASGGRDAETIANAARRGPRKIRAPRTLRDRRGLQPACARSAGRRRLPRTRRRRLPCRARRRGSARHGERVSDRPDRRGGTAVSGPGQPRRRRTASRPRTRAGRHRSCCGSAPFSRDRSQGGTRRSRRRRRRQRRARYARRDRRVPRSARSAAPTAKAGRSAPPSSTTSSCSG